MKQNKGIIITVLISLVIGALIGYFTHKEVSNEDSFLRQVDSLETVIAVKEEAYEDFKIQSQQRKQVHYNNIDQNKDHYEEIINYEFTHDQLDSILRASYYNLEYARLQRDSIKVE